MNQIEILELKNIISETMNLTWGTQQTFLEDWSNGLKHTSIENIQTR